MGDAQAMLLKTLAGETDIQFLRVPTVREPAGAHDERDEGRLPAGVLPRTPAEPLHDLLQLPALRPGPARRCS